MEKNLTLKEKVQAYMKRQKATSGITVAIISVILAVIVVGAGISGNAINKDKVVDNSSVSEYAGDKLVKGTVVGDMMLGRAITNKGSKNNYSGMFSGVSSLWKDSDYVSGNLECALLDEKTSNNKKIRTETHINAEAKTANVLKESGFTLISLANNHVSDFGPEGVVSTLDALNKAGLKYVGAGKNLTEAASYDIQEINGVKIATVSISDIIPPGSSATNFQAGILSTSTVRYFQAVREASAEADLVIVNMHWGVQYGMKISEQQQQLGRNLINFGADIVIGSHPHVTQPVEKYKDGIIFYSVGNFVFDEGFSRTKDSVVLNYYVDKDGNLSFELVPVRIKNGYPTVTNNAYFKKRTFKSLTRKLKDSDYEVKSNTLLLKNAVKIDLSSKDSSNLDGTGSNAGAVTGTTDNNVVDPAYGTTNTYGTDNYGGTTDTGIDTSATQQ